MKQPDEYPRILWEKLGWRPISPHAAPGPDEGAVAFLVIAPWCPDCHAEASQFIGQAPASARIWLVGEFSAPEEIQEFARRYSLPWPVLYGQPAKTEACREAAKLGELRSAWGDTRHWGLPLWIEAEIRDGWLISKNLRCP